MRAALSSRLVLVGAIALVAGCFDQVLAPDFQSDGRLEITNDEGSLDGRVAYTDLDVPIDAPAPAAGVASVAGVRGRSSVRLTLVAEVAPPTVGGTVVQATSVWATSDSKAVVSYNVAGSVAAGAMDYFIRLTNKTPKLKSSVTFLDSDVNAVFTDGSWAYAAVATTDTSFAFPAVLERVQLVGNSFSLSQNERVPLTSFAATSAVSANGVVYATSGDGGGVFAFDPADMSLRGQYALDDARWVAWDEPNGRIVVAQGTPGRLSVFTEGSFPSGSMQLLNTFTFPGADVAESKSTLEIVGGKAFVAAGPAGVQVVCLDNGAVVDSIPRPDPASVGLDPSVVVTNAVTVQDDMIFISDGEAGVYAAAGAQSFATSPCNASQQISVLGKLRFDDLQSVNHVVYRNDQLFVAAGLGGIKVVDVELR